MVRSALWNVRIPASINLQLILTTSCFFLVAYGVLDTGYRPDLPVEEAIDLGKRAIYHATYRDAASGGINNLFHVTKEGWTQIHAIDVNDMHYQFQEEKKNAMAT